MVAVSRKKIIIIFFFFFFKRPKKLGELTVTCLKKKVDRSGFYFILFYFALFCFIFNPNNSNAHFGCYYASQAENFVRTFSARFAL